MVSVEWKGKMSFQATAKSGQNFLMDAYPESGGDGQGPTPLETLLSALAGCTGIDIISILAKKRQEVTSYRIEVSAERAPEGIWPRPFISIHLKHILTGVNLDGGAVEAAIKLSDEKYCSVLATFRENPDVTSSWELG
jgi:putative redox protein